MFLNAEQDKSVIGARNEMKHDKLRHRLSRSAVSAGATDGTCAPNLDAHCHLQHDPCFRSVAQKHSDLRFFCMTETAGEYEHLRDDALPGNVFAGLGLHPWRVSPDHAAVCAQVDAVLRCLPGAWLVGEVGLDFSAKHARTRSNQMAAFRAIAHAAAHEPLGEAVLIPADLSSLFASDSRRVLSIHAVQAADQALAILRDAGCLDSCVCIFHWFSGSSEQLVQARRDGCFFSFGPRALATKRGRAYASQIPAKQLLRESDAFSVEELLTDGC